MSAMSAFSPFRQTSETCFPVEILDGLKTAVRLLRNWTLTVVSALAGMIAIVSGVVCVGAGLARLGFITELLSKPIRYGYMNGIALTVLLSQVPKLFGFSVTAHGPLRQTWRIVDKVLAGNTNIVSLLIGASSLALILFLKRWPRVPGILIAVVATTVSRGLRLRKTGRGV